MMTGYRRSLQGSQALLATILVWLLCITIQWYLGYVLSSEVSRTIALSRLLVNSVALLATLGLADRIAIQLLLITPPQRPLLLLLQTMLLVPLISFFALDWVVWALPCLLLSLYMQLLCYSRPDRVQRLTLAGAMMGVATLLYPPLLWAVPIGLSLLALMKIRRLKAYLAYFCGFMAILWLVLPSLYLLRGEEALMSLYGELRINIETILSPSSPFDWIGWSIVALLLVMARIGLEGVRGGSHVVTWYRQRALLLMAAILLLLALLCADRMRATLLLSVPLVIIPIIPWASQLSRNGWYYLLPLLIVLVITMQLFLAGIIVL